MPAAGFETANPPSERLRTDALDGVATVIGCEFYITWWNSQNR